MLKTISCLCLWSFVASIAAADPFVPVVGGSPVPAGKWPDAVAVLAQTAACTGTLIAPDVVLTAGHCIETHPIVVVVDTTDFGKPGGEMIAVKSATAYPDWRDQYDVGVVVLVHGAATKPRAIAGTCSSLQVMHGGNVHVVGFGLTKESGTGTNTKLHEATMAIDDARCAQDAACEAKIAPDGEFTAGGQGTDSCFGDSGGPAYLDTASGPALIGVVSRGLAVEGSPCSHGGVYVRADKVAPWIEHVIGHQLARSTCGKADEQQIEASGSDGCSAGGEGGLSVGLALGLVAVRRRRRRTFGG